MDTRAIVNEDIIRYGPLLTDSLKDGLCLHFSAEVVKTAYGTLMTLRPWVLMATLASSLKQLGRLLVVT